ncbi:MAG: ATP-grasp domain-containing protein, partial [Desulfonatronovibrionaceae bacterium]
VEGAGKVAQQIGYPVVVRPSYVLGGRAMEIVYDIDQLCEYFKNEAVVSMEHPILIDKFLEHAIEVDVDALSDGKDTYIAGIMEHIEEAGVHSGDSACVLPPHTISEETIDQIKQQTAALARELNVVGLLNIQFAVKDQQVYILEVNPRASRTSPFVSKATGVPLAKLATRVMMGQSLQELDPWSMRSQDYYSVKEAVLPFNKYPGVDVLLGPEMRSTGEVMGIDHNLGLAFMKSQMGAGQMLPEQGSVFISVNDYDKPHCLEPAGTFARLGFEIAATRGTAAFLKENGIDSKVVNKVFEGRPNVIDSIKNKEISLVINTSSGKKTVSDSSSLRQAAVLYRIPYTTTITAAKALALAIQEKTARGLTVKSIQEYYHS